jgi:alpha-1,2-mannosyltransferase
LRAACVNGKLQPVTIATRRGRALWIVAFALYAVVAIEVGVRRGGDFEAELGQSERLLHGIPLFAAVSTRIGLPWPPFSALALTPFALLARVDLRVAKAMWAVLSLACLFWSVCRVPSERRQAVGWAVVAVAVPLHRNFEDLNVNCVLLALTIAAVVALDRGREQRGAGWIGAATALKAFPGLLLGYLAYRRRWRALALGTALAAALTIGALLPYGFPGAWDGLRDWLTLSAPHNWNWSGDSNQSLAALVARLHGPPLLLVTLDLLCLGAAVAVLRRHRTGGTVLPDVAAVIVVATLLSPIAHTHYFLLAFPAWVVVLQHPPPTGGRRAWIAPRLAAGLATSGALTVWSLELRHTLLAHSIYTWGALLLLCLLVLERPSEFAAA